jgi:hypothetical protein
VIFLRDCICSKVASIYTTAERMIDSKVLKAYIFAREYEL